MNGADGLGFRRQRCELIGYDPHLPGTAAISGNPHYLCRSFDFVAHAERTAIDKGRNNFGRAFGSQLLRTLGALGRDDDPFLSEIVLAQLGHI
jgi:hypothetical protein